MVVRGLNGGGAVSTQESVSMMDMGVSKNSHADSLMALSIIADVGRWCLGICSLAEWEALEPGQEDDPAGRARGR